MHTVKAVDGGLLIGTFTDPWILLNGLDLSISNQIIALHSQHRRKQATRYKADHSESVFLLEDDDSPWRLCKANSDYSICPTYPSSLIIPKSISDSVVKHAAAHRVKRRLPILAYQHGSPDGPVLLRSGQPLVGLRRNRSIQDEHLLEAFRTCNGKFVERKMLIIDARPTINAVANTIAGAGFEPLDWYRGCQREFVNLENIHHIRAAFLHLALDQSDWLGHIKRLLVATKTIVQAMSGEASKAVLVHCSDGWDRTSQLVSLAKVCLDPHYRSMSGLIELIQVDWLDAGHRFTQRLGHDIPLVNGLPFAHPHSTTSNNHTPKWLSNLLSDSADWVDQWCPIFPQFLDALAQLVIQSPFHFAYDTDLLHRLYVESMTNSLGLFSGNCQAERLGAANWNSIIDLHDQVTHDHEILIPDLEIPYRSILIRTPLYNIDEA